MRKMQTTVLMAALIIWSSGAVSVAMAQRQGAAAKTQHEHQQETELKVGKTGDISFSQEVQAGSMKLEPGRYQIQHRVDGSDHLIHFTKLSKQNPYRPDSGTPVAHPGEMKCKLQPLAEKARYTAVYTTKEGNVTRITKVQIQGENVAHMFE